MISFKQLREANLLRVGSSFHSLDAWAPWEWSNAAAGEMGEMCAELLTLVAAIAAKSGATSNLTKKMNRIWPACQFKASWNKPEDQRLGELFTRAGGEIADQIIYLDLLAARLGLDTGLVVQRKFNEKSDEIGSTVKL